MLSIPLLAAALTLAQEGTEAPAGASAKIAVLPFASLAGDLPGRTGPKASGMLATEFKSAEQLQLVDLKKGGAGGADPFADELAAARKLVEEAKAQRGKRKFRLAEEALLKALDGYRKAAGGVTDVGELADAYALLAAVQFNTGKDDEGQRSLSTALSLSPERELPLAQTSALFARVVADTRKAVQTGPKGSMLVETTPAGAALVIDGVPLGGSPLQVKDVPAGQHAWRGTLANGELVGGLVEVLPGKQAKVTVTASTKDPESRILSALAQNKLDADLVAAAKEQAQAVGADLLLFGALSKEGKGLALDAFVYSAQAGEVRRLSRTRFDTELLSAGVEFLNLTRDVASKGAKVGEAVKVPAPVAAGLTQGSTQVAEAKYGVQPGKALTLDAADPVADPKDSGPRKPLEQKRVPLKKQ